MTETKPANPADPSGEALCALVEATLDDGQGQKVQRFDVRHLTSMTDWMIIASGRSARHLRALSDRLVEAAKEAGERPLGTEGEDSGDWVLVDLNGVIVHLMRAEIRELYQLEKLWGIAPGQDAEPET